MTAPRSDREPILARIREALRRVAQPASGPAVPASADDFHRWLPPAGPDYEAQAAAFGGQSTALKTEFFRFPSMDAARAAFRGMAAAEKWGHIATHEGTLPAALLEGCGLPLFTVAPGYDTQALEACPVGVTGCEALVAQTGSILVSARSAGGRALSVLPPHHVVVAGRDQVVPDMPSAFLRLEALYGNDLPGFLSFITGPSRTGDIERILVLGAHGPKRLTVFLVE